MKLYFKNSQGKERVIAEVNDKKEALDEIYKFCKERNFEVYYVRCWETPKGRLTFDCGSHSEFFYLDKADSDIIK